MNYHVISTVSITETSPRVITLNTLFNGRCYILDSGNESKTYWHINLPTDGSVANLYALREGGENALILGIWHYPIKMLQIGNLMYQSMIMKKEFHIRASTSDSHCTHEPTEKYYKVKRKYYKMTFKFPTFHIPVSKRCGYRGLL